MHRFFHRKVGILLPNVIYLFLHFRDEMVPILKNGMIVMRPSGLKAPGAKRFTTIREVANSDPRLVFAASSLSKPLSDEPLSQFRSFNSAVPAHTL